MVTDHLDLSQAELIAVIVDKEICERDGMLCLQFVLLQLKESCNSCSQSLSPSALRATHETRDV